MTNCAFTGNRAVANGGGVSGSTLAQCTLTGNSAAAGGAAETSTLYNCIAYYNAAFSEPNCNGGTLSYSCSTPLPPGPGNIDRDPLFVDDAGGNFRLAYGSPCIDAGTSVGAPTNDIEGTARPCGIEVDMGAYEFGDSWPSTRFKRGDANASNAIDIADAISVLAYLFGSADDPSKAKVAQCLDAADANDDGTVDIADAVTILGHLFSGKGPLPPPFGECGIDPTIDELDCASFDPCHG